MTTRSTLVLFAGVLTAAATWATTSFGADAGATDGAAPDSGPKRPDASVPRRDASVSRPDAATRGPDAATLPPPTGVVGKGCTKDADCATGLTCLLPSGDALGGGGPAGGICTVDCANGLQADCDAVDTGSLCVTDVAGSAFHCLEGCFIGNGVPSDAPKCHDRPDMACAPTDTGDAFCAPTCRGDFECGSRKCDPAGGLCTGTVAGTLATGSPCDPSATANDCRGVCMSFATTGGTKDNSQCSAICSLGMPGGCGRDPKSTARPEEACVLGVPGEATGDFGECAQLCDCDTDCRNPKFVCLAVPASLNLGRAGYCTAGQDMTGAVPGIPCGAPDGGKKPGTGGSTGATSPDGGAGTKGAGPAKGADSGGCGCRIDGGAGNPRSGSLALLAVGLAVLARRRRARR